MRTMKFLPELKEFLKANQFIYTVRGYDMDQRLVNVEGVGVCERTPYGEISFERLKPFVPYSGFRDLESWIEKIRVFIKEGQQAWLYKVEIKTPGFSNHDQRKDLKNKG